MDKQFENPDEKTQVSIDPDLRELIPQYLKNRRMEIEVLRGALEGEDFDILEQTGHRIKGSAPVYGFKQIGVFGETLEQTAQQQDGAAIKNILLDYSNYLSRIKVAYK